MAWFKVDDGFHDHPKVDDLSLEALGLWLLCATWSSRHLTDGVVPASRVRKFGGTPDMCSELVRANMWRTSPDVRDGGSANSYEYVNWGDWNPTKDAVEEGRRKARKRMQDLRGKRGDQQKRSPEHSPNERRTSPDVRNPVPSRPVPPPSNEGGEGVQGEVVQSEPSSVGAASSPPTGRRKPARPIPEDWSPTTTHEEKAQKLGLDVHQVADEFVNWAISKDERKADWSAAFHNWLTREAKYRQDRASRPQFAPKGQAKEDANLASLAAWVESKNKRQNELPFPGGDPA